MTFNQTDNDITINGPNLTNYVDTTSAQTVGGNKTFTGSVSTGPLAANGILSTNNDVYINKTINATPDRQRRSARRPLTRRCKWRYQQ